MMLSRTLVIVCLISLGVVESEQEKQTATKPGIKISFTAIFSGTADTFGVDVNDDEGNTLFKLSFRPASESSGATTAMEALGEAEQLAPYPNLVDGEEFTVLVVCKDDKYTAYFNGELMPGVDVGYNNDDPEKASSFELWGGDPVGDDGVAIEFLTEEKDSFTQVTETYTFTYPVTQPKNGDKKNDTDDEEPTVYRYTYTIPNNYTAPPPEPCTAGYYMTESGCEDCPENTYSGDNASECTPCPDGKIAANGSRTVEDCVHAPCTAGYYMTDDGCEICGENTFSGNGSASCFPCPKRMVSEPGSSHCDYPDECPGNMMGCDNGTKCFENWRLCDGHPDCKDGSDESMELYCANQPECPPGTITCADNVTCVSTRGRCDGHQYCPDGSDEDAEFCLGYDCPPNQQKCGDNTKCVNKWKLCDGKPECSDGSDESVEFCEAYNCPAAKAQCDDGLQCVSKKRVCDGKSDCKDGSLDDPWELDFCAPDPCNAGSYMSDERKCKKCPRNTWSAAGATNCRKCRGGKISKPGSKSAAACRWPDGKKPPQKPGQKPGRGVVVGRVPGSKGEVPSGGGPKRGKGVRRWKKNKKTRKDRGPDPEPTDEAPIFTTSNVPDIPDEEQKPTCDCFTEECGYCKDLSCAVKQDLPKYGEGIRVQITSKIRLGKYNTVMLYDDEGNFVGKLQYNRKRIFLTGCIGCPTPAGLKQKIEDGNATWDISLMNGLLKIGSEGEIFYKRFLTDECAEIYTKVRYFAFTDMTCGSTYSHVADEMEAGEKMTDDCSCPLEE